MTIPNPDQGDHPRAVTPRVAVFAPYWTFWEPSVGPGLRSRRRELLQSVVDRLQDHGVEVVGHTQPERSLVADPDQGRQWATEAAGHDPDVLLVVQTMAAPPSHALAVLDHMAQPVVIWALQDAAVIPADFSAGHITSLGATVGTPMLTNVLHRLERPFELVVSAPHDDQAASAVASRLRAGAVAGRLVGSRLARVGRPMVGYACVDADDEELARALGLEVVALSPLELKQRYDAVSDEELARQRRTAAGYQQEPPPDPTENLDRSLRLAAALEALDRAGGFAAGAMNCHVPEIRFGPDPGLTPCYGLGCETTRGVPWSCTGDVLTAVALLVGKQLSGAALYHEVEAIDFATGEVAVANSGEHDLGWCPADRTPSLGPNPWFAADERTGYRIRFELPAGPASMIGFAHQPDHPSGFGFVVAEGHITGRELPDNPTVGGMFRFSHEPVTEAWTRWAAAGVNHHSAISPGHLGSAVAAMANFARVGCTVI